MSAHTPGPWTFSKADDGERRIANVNEEAVVWDSGCYEAAGPSRDADWRLIAAAPDLVSALTVEQINWLLWMASNPAVENAGAAAGLRALRAAVVRATGGEQ